MIICGSIRETCSRDPVSYSLDSGFWILLFISPQFKLELPIRYSLLYKSSWPNEKGFSFCGIQLTIKSNVFTLSRSCLRWRNLSISSVLCCWSNTTPCAKITTLTIEACLLWVMYSAALRQFIRKKKTQKSLDLIWKVHQSFKVFTW